MRSLINLCVGMSLATAMLPAQSAQQPDDSALNKVLNASSRSSEVPEGISEVRAAALRELGRGLGIRAGLADESRLVVAEIETQKSALDVKFNFGSLMFQTGALPPVIEEAQDVISVMDYSMRVAGKIYRIVAPASFHSVNWRNYLYLGLATTDDPLISESQRSVYPRDDKESSYWNKIVREGAAEGHQQARQIFKINLARLERDFNGMRRFYELAARGLVSPPIIASATESVNRPDPNTIIIGESIFRITSQPKFEADETQWKAKQ